MHRALRQSEDENDVFVKSGEKNRRVLWITAIVYLLFVSAEIVGALAGNSLSLLGDAAAMSVDVVSYFCSIWADSVKHRNGGFIDKRSQLIVEVFVPGLSIVALLAVSAYVSIDAVTVIANPSDAVDDVNIYFLYGFSVGNALVDAISLALFYTRRKEILGEEEEELLQDLDLDERTVSIAKLSAIPTANHVDTNMAGALSHVGSDTMRTAAVFVAAVVATPKSISGVQCDAWATIIVTFSIVVFVIPVVWEIAKAYCRILDSTKKYRSSRDSSMA